MRLPLILLLLAGSLHANINPSRAGRTWIECLGGNTYMLHIDININGVPLSSDSVFVDWGDGNEQAIAMTDNDAVYFNSNNTSSVMFTSQRTYSPGNYSIVIRAGKRLSGISNIANSNTTDFILLNEIVVDPNIGCNNSPVDPTPQLELEWSSGTNNIGGFYYFDLEGDSIVLSMIGTGPGYQMPDVVGGGTYTLVSASQNHSWNPQIPGLYTVVILCEEYVQLMNGNYVINGVATTEVLIDVDNVEAISEFTARKISVYPNPATGILNIATTEECKVEILDVNGRVVISEQLLSTDNTINISSLAEGVYCIRIDGIKSEQLVISR